MSGSKTKAFISTGRTNPAAPVALRRPARQAAAISLIPAREPVDVSYILSPANGPRKLTHSQIKRAVERVIRNRASPDA